MIARLHRILVTALLGALMGLGVIRALFGGRPRAGIAVPDRGRDLVAIPVPVARTAGRRRMAAAGLAGLLLASGAAWIVLLDPDAGPRPGSATREGQGRPLAALSPARPGGGAAPAPQADIPTAPAPRDAVPTPGAGSDARALVTATPPAPSFDVVRVEPNGDAVIAGRAAPDATVELLVDGRPVASARADAAGRFTVTPEALPTGGSEVTLRAVEADGREQRSPARVAVVVAPAKDARPLVALTSPDAPTRVLSQPDRQRETRAGAAAEPGRQAPREGEAPSGASQAPASGTEAGAGAVAPPTIVSIDSHPGGRLFVTARAPAGAAIRLYLNDTLIAPATVAPDGSVTFTIGRGVKPGAYTVRLDRMDPATGAVRARAEVPFTAPDPAHDGGVEYAAPNTAASGDAARPRTPPAVPRQGAAEARSGRPAVVDPLETSSTRSRGGDATSASVYVPEVATARIVRGDSLWRISRRAYGEGDRYTVIYDANQDQIRDPDLIYPGQVFVLPTDGAAERRD
ncbi:Nucleoid-associated protein YgaU, contains BON and LysM domains [Methylobacterium sp. ap11]|uniref:LysM peptidoglycan-binding domain-containing protein n=1 Tax=Methylobacterium sp. ap11 TaxID=1761799 RepID=UPI0008AB8F46|nr:Ig-like domain-containing protein [Methylobacterium sp. ap11]SEP07250.1 Nucleoid-associated protein YgaU, contains BON and LysM domains [Methylobacterium sp. ap11]